MKGEYKMGRGKENNNSSKKKKTKKKRTKEKRSVEVRKQSQNGASARFGSLLN